jgi:hypothetical protein
MKRWAGVVNTKVAVLLDEHHSQPEQRTPRRRSQTNTIAETCAQTETWICIQKPADTCARGRCWCINARRAVRTQQVCVATKLSTRGALKRS